MPKRESILYVLDVRNQSIGQIKGVGLGSLANSST